MDDLIMSHEPQEDCDCHSCAIAARDKHKAALRAMGIFGNTRRAMEESAEALDKLRSAPRALSSDADFDALTWTFKVAPDCLIGAGVYALVWMGPNAEVTGRASAACEGPR